MCETEGVRPWTTLLCLLAAGCAERLVIGELSDASSTMDAGPETDADSGDGGATGPSMLDCDGTGPAFVAGDGPATACTTGTPPRTFRYALCSCEDVITEGQLSTDGFDRRGGVRAPVAGAGSVGVTGTFFSSQPVNLGGSLIVDGTEPLAVEAPLSVGGNLFSNGRMVGMASVSVAGRAQIDGDVDVASLAVAQGLTVQQGSVVAVNVGGMPAVTEVDLQVQYAPCDCAAPLDLRAALRQAAEFNDNRAAGIGPRGLSTLEESKDLVLNCGVYHVEELVTHLPLTVTIVGRVVLYVETVLTALQEGPIRIQLAGEDAELDVIVGEDVSIADRFELGAEASAGRVRLYVAGSNIYIGGETTIAGPIYAPGANFAADQPVEIFGSAYVGRWFTEQRAELHFDLGYARAECGQSACATAGDCAADNRCVGDLCLP